MLIGVSVRVFLFVLRLFLLLTYQRILFAAAFVLQMNYCRNVRLSVVIHGESLRHLYECGDTATLNGNFQRIK